MAELCDFPIWVYAYFLAMAFFAGIGVSACINVATAIREQKQ